LLCERGKPEHVERTPQELMVAPAVHDGERFRRIEVVVERSGKPLPLSFGSRLGRAAKDVAEALDPRARRFHGLVREVDRLRPVRREEVDEDRLGPPAREHVVQGSDVPDRLRHLLAIDLEQTVVHPELRELAACRLGLCALVLVVREDEVQPAEMDLEPWAEELLGHRRALDVPAGTAATPWRVPGGVLSLLRRLPEREVARILLEWAAV